MSDESLAAPLRGRLVTRHLSLVTMLAAALLALPLAATAQQLGSALAELAAYAGSDRQQRLAEGARREGSLNVYTSLPVDDMAALNAAFEKRTGVKVRIWRASSEKVVQRAIAEDRKSTRLNS